MLNDFEKRRVDFDRSFNSTKRFVNAMFIIVPVLMVVVVSVTIYVAAQAGCLRSMILNGVCLSDPAIDNVIKNVIK